MLALLYLAVTTFRRSFNRHTVVGRILGRLSYGVYVIHLPVLGAIALMMLGVDLPALVKYPVLVLASCALSSLLVGG